MLRRVAIAAISLTAAASVRAQTRVAPYPEFRGDAVFTRWTGAQAGAGVVIPAGVYTRFSLGVAGGATWRDNVALTSGRVDAIARFLLDPLREVPVGLSMGGGLTLPYVDGDKNVRPYLTAVIDLEGRRRGAFTPGVQIALGGGTRIGVVLRGSPRAWR
jgi:hypothetical protein